MNHQQYKDWIAKQFYGMTKAEAHEQGICIKCKEKAVTTTQAGVMEYNISGFCEPCFDSFASALDPDTEEDSK